MRIKSRSTFEFRGCCSVKSEERIQVVLRLHRRIKFDDERHIHARHYHWILVRHNHLDQIIFNMELNEVKLEMKTSHLFNLASALKGSAHIARR